MQTPEAAFVNDLTQAFLFLTAMSVPATRFFKTQAQFFDPGN